MKWLRLGGGRSYLGRSITSLGPSGPAREILGNLPATQLSSKGSPMHNPATLIRRLIDLGHLLGYAWFIAFGAKQKGFHARHRLDSVELFGCSLKLVSSIQPTKRPFYKAIHGPLTPLDRCLSAPSPVPKSPSKTGAATAPWVEKSGGRQVTCLFKVVTESRVLRVHNMRWVHAGLELGSSWCHKDPSSFFSDVGQQP